MNFLWKIFIGAIVGALLVFVCHLTGIAAVELGLPPPRSTIPPAVLGFLLIGTTGALLAVCWALGAFVLGEE